ncbi:MAG: polysaccharide biosynthesis tyrosine autokinase [Chlorobia bacterium]|nr:polysaccharide biosynthesis tyrosine autokinase [Fimbriimonadaceae bacterium]
MEVTPRPISLRDFSGLIRRQKGWVIAITLGSIALAFALVRFTTPVFQTSITILVEAGTQSRSGNDPVEFMSLSTPTMPIPTQMQVLQSPELIQKAYDQLQIDATQLGKRAPKIKVESVNDTNVLRVSVDSTDPALAKQLADEIPDRFGQYVKDDRQEEIQKSIQFLIDKIAEQQKILDENDLALSTYRKKRNLLPVVGEIANKSQRVSDAEFKVENAKTAVAVAQKQIDALLLEKAKEKPTTSTGAKQENTMAAEGLKSQIASMEGERSALLTRVYEDHEDVVMLDRKLAAKRKELRDLPTTLSVGSSATNPDINQYDMQIAGARVQKAAAMKEQQEAQAWLDKSKRELRTYQDVEPEEKKLIDASAGKQENIEQLNTMLRSFQIRRESARELVRKLSNPTEPEIVKPKEAQYLAIALLMGLFVAVGFAMLKDSIDDRVTTADEIYGLTGLPSLGDIPALPRRPGALTLAGPNDRLLERYRILKFNLLFSTLENPARSIMITSSGPNEGKTEFACNLAVAACGEGRRVILVDANLRYPSIHRKMNVDGKPGLTDVIAGDALLSDSLHSTAVPGLSVLTCGTEISNPAEVLSSSGMHKLKAQLDKEADLVIFDSACCLGVADALVLSRVADSVVYVAKSGTTKRSSIRQGLSALQQANARVLGVAMNGAA